MSSREPGTVLRIDNAAECIWRDGEKVGVPPKAFLLGRNYAASGISGYLTDTLTILPSSLPALEDTDAGTDTFWRLRLTVTCSPRRKLKRSCTSASSINRPS